MLLNEKSPWYHLKKLGFTWLIDFDFNYTSSLLSWRSLLRTTANKDHKSTREMNLAIKRQEEWGNSLVANSRSGNVVPPATLSSVGTRTVVFTLTSDIRTTDQSNARSRKFTLCQVTFLAYFSVICYEKWPVLTKNKTDGLQREGESSDRNFNYLLLINWSIFYGNFMVTVLSSVEHGCSDWSMWLEKKLLLPVRPISA